MKLIALNGNNFDFSILKNEQITEDDEKNFSHVAKQALNNYFNKVAPQVLIGKSLQEKDVNLDTDEGKLLLMMSKLFLLNVKDGNELEYNDFMTEFLIGSHIVLELEGQKSILEKFKVTKRVSSHYVDNIGDKTHYWVSGQEVIAGALCGETEMPVTVTDKGESELVAKGKSWEQYQKNENKSEAVKSKKFFWIQTERNPDGPKILDYIKHRLFDFVIYFFLKNIFKYDRPQVSRYTARAVKDVGTVVGRGRPDTNSIHLRLNNVWASSVITNK